MVRIVKVNPDNPDASILEEAVSILRRGGLVVYPTDTVYGLGADPWNPDACRRVHKAKGRQGKPLPVLLHDSGGAERFAFVTKKASRLMKEFWPGPVTIVLEARPQIPEPITLGTGRIGLRVPNCRVARELARGLEGGIVGTSANLSGAPSPRTAEEAYAQIGRRVDLILDGGVTRIGLSSTVVDLTSSPPKILRIGPIDPAEIEAVLGEVEIA